MVLESLVNPFVAEKRPWEMLFVGMLYNTVAIWLSLWIFDAESSMVMVFLTTIACVPLLYSVIKQEELKDKVITDELVLLKEHSRVLLYLMFLFVGIVISVAFWYLVLPSFSDGSANLFRVQIHSIESVNSRITGNAISSSFLFQTILANNVKVLLFCLLFAFFYGMGAIFILAWNASTIGVALGTFINNHVGAQLGYATIIPVAIVRYFIHGFFEIAAYFAAGLAGGIISIAVIRHEVGTKEFKHILYDSMDLILVASGLILIGAAVEAYIIPALF